MKTRLNILTIIMILVVLGGTAFIIDQNQKMQHLQKLTSEKEHMENMFAENISKFPQDTVLKKAKQKELSYTLDGDTKVFELSAGRINWELVDGTAVTAYAYNQSIPGPTIRVQEGDHVRIKFTNNLPESTTIHWHGIPVPNPMDGVPGITQDPIEPGETFTYEFTAKPHGTYMYHPHQRSTAQMDMGLSGIFIVEGKDDKKYDEDYAILLDEWMVDADGTNGADGTGHAGHDLAEYNYFTMNGKSFPDTERLNVEEGDLVKIRLLNAGYQIHPMHLHGHFFTVTHKDGRPLPAPYQADTLSVLPGEIYDIEFIADNPGDWVFHCHQLHHVANNGVEPGGLLTVVHYKNYKSFIPRDQAKKSD